MSDKTIIEVNGVKLEVDLRTARRIDEIRVGDRVKVLTKDGYGSGMKVFPGVVIGFEPFNQLPTIIVAYLKTEYSGADLKFVYFNSETKDTEIIKAVDDDTPTINRELAEQYFAREIAKKQREIEDIEHKRDYFRTNFKQYWSAIELETA